MEIYNKFDIGEKVAHGTVTHIVQYPSNIPGNEPTNVKTYITGKVLELAVKSESYIEYYVVWEDGAKEYCTEIELQKLKK